MQRNKDRSCCILIEKYMLFWLIQHLWRRIHSRFYGSPIPPPHPAASTVSDGRSPSYSLSCSASEFMTLSPSASPVMNRSLSSRRTATQLPKPPMSWKERCLKAYKSYKRTTDEIQNAITGDGQTVSYIKQI